MLTERIPVAREGIPFIATAALATVTSAQLGWEIPAAIAFLITAFVLYFFRDPERVVPADDNAVVSPADGKVLEIAPASDPVLENVRRQRVSIFMNVFNCHVNRAPIAGVIDAISYREGSFISANRDRAMLENEQCALLLRRDDGLECTVVQVAGLIARRIVCRAETGDRLEKGERFGMIRFGSRLDVYLPPEVEFTVRPGERVVAGQSVIARKGGNLP